MKRITKIAPLFAYIVTVFTIMASMGFTGLYLAVGPDLPDVETIREIRLQTPMSVYSKDGQLINEYGDIRRIPITLDQVPQNFINALLSTEDVRFYEHSGVDFKGVIRAILKLAMTGTKSQGASTITMLVARNYYLSREKKFSRKFTEMFVAWKLESALTKDEILEIFLNKIPFGHRSAGLGAASEVYYGKTLKELSLAQLATLAGIPKGQSVFNPISRPDKARVRRTHVLGRMLTEGYISQSQFDEANQSPIKTFRHGAKTTVSAPYVASMVRKDMIERFGRDIALNDGLKVFTSVDPILQEYAQTALRSSLIEYDQRHGFRNVEQHYIIDQSILESDMLTWLNDFTQIGKLIPALVINTTETTAEILLSNGEHGKILLQDSLWARKYIDENHLEYTKLNDINQIIIPGDIVRVMTTERFEKAVILNKKEMNITTVLTAEKPSSSENENQTEPLENELMTGSLVPQLPSPLPIFLLSQIPDVNAGFVVLNPKNGSVEALVGGFSFSKNQFNMVTQARRQLGSNIKPFIYSSALAKGFTAADLINDSPIIHWDSSAGTFWRPENDNEIYLGPITLRHALRKSINTVSIRLIRKIGPGYAKKYLQKIGFPGQHMRPFESLALGTASFTPLEVVTGYAALANGGYKVLPWYINKIEDSQGNILFEQSPIQVCENCLELLAKEKRDALDKQQAADALESLIAEETLEDTTNPLLSQQNESKIQVKTQSELNDKVNTSVDSPESLIIPIAVDKIATQVIDSRNRHIINSMLQDVIHRGTAWRTLFNSKSPLLKRHDIAGKTGTTNESKDAWFSGYNSRYVASAWVGFVDHSKKLGKREFGAKAALPIWQKFMEKALKGMPEENLPRPDGIVDVKIDLTNGKLASANTKRSEFEVFRVENAPTEYSEPATENVFDELDKLDKEETDEQGLEDSIDF